VTAEPAAAFDDHSFSNSEMPRDGGNRHGGIALAQDVLVLTQAQDERNVLALQIATRVGDRAPTLSGRP
jgi:hypothetical protein